MVLACMALAVTIHAQNLQKVDFRLDSLSAQSVREALLPYFAELANTELILGHVSQSPVGWHLSLKQAFRGKELYQSELRLHLTNELKAYLLSATLFPLRHTNARIFRENLMAKSQQLIEENQASDWLGKEIWFREGGTWIPAYALRIFSDQGAWAAREIIINASDQSIIRQEDLSTYFGHHVKKDTTGWGRIFLPDPCTRAKAPYGVYFSDAKDGHSPVLEVLMDTVELKNLTYSEEDSLFLLEGPYVKVVDRAAHYKPVAVSKDGKFFFNRDASGFEDVMVYYHIDWFRRYVSRMGFGQLLNRPIEVDAHGYGNNDQSAFVANGGNSYILYGDGGVDDAEDADVIIHEYIHALSYDASPETNKGFERMGIDEGFADYFAAAYSYDLSHWRWFDLFNWDGHNEFWQGRKAISTESYPPTNGFSSIYDVGTLWASTLMNIRFDLGAEVVDPLVLQTFYFLNKSMKLPDVAELLLLADTLLYDGAYTPVIRDRLCQRNLYSSESCIAVANESGPFQGEKSLKIGPNPLSDELHVSWEHPCDMELRLENMYGQLILKKEIFRQNQLTLKIPRSLPPGNYFLKLATKDGETIVYKLNIVGY